MAKIISVHSFRGGTGKSNTTANVATLLASDGRRVGVIDTDILSPGIHVIFGLDQEAMPHSLNDYLWDRCGIQEAAYDVTASLGAPVSGRVFLIPSSLKPGEIARVMREGYDVGLLDEGFRSLVDTLQLDVLLIDTHPGLNEETLLSIALSDVVVIVLRPDQQDYLGTSVTVDVARRLEVPSLLLVINKVPGGFDSDDVKATAERAYGCEVAAVLPHSDEMMTLASAGVFALRYPRHSMTGLFRQLAGRLVA